MPIYPYVCTACGHEFDELQKISDAPLKDCPACGESALRKRLTAPAFQLKGTGWYETDFKNSGKDRKAAAGGGDGKDEKASGDKDAKTSGKPEARDTGTKPQSGSKGPSSGGKSEPAASSAGKEE